MKNVKKQFIGRLILILLGGMILNVSAQTDTVIEEINKMYKETNEKIAECEKNGEYSSTFLSEMHVNKNNGSYPAVGIFQRVVKFYYTYGNRETNPYPDRLLKIEIETKRSANTENYEYLFNPDGQLIFYTEKTVEGRERRFYFASEKLIKSLKGEKAVNIKSRPELEAVKIILNEKKKLLVIFHNSLE